VADVDEGERDGRDGGDGQDDGRGDQDDGGGQRENHHDADDELSHVGDAPGDCRKLP